MLVKLYWLTAAWQPGISSWVLKYPTRLNLGTRPIFPEFNAFDVSLYTCRCPYRYAGRVYSNKHNLTIWRPSVCLSVPSFSNVNSARAHIQRDSSGSGPRRGQHTFPAQYYENGRTCLIGRQTLISKILIVHRESKRSQHSLAGKFTADSVANLQ